jgi:hypothetical protein
MTVIPAGAEARARKLLAVCEAADDQDTGSLDAFREAATVGAVAELARDVLELVQAVETLRKAQRAAWDLLRPHYPPVIEWEREVSDTLLLASQPLLADYVEDREMAEIADAAVARAKRLALACEALAAANEAALAHARGLRMDTPEDEKVRRRLVETLELAKTAVSVVSGSVDGGDGHT